MQEQLEDAQSQLERTKRELKKRKESEGLLQTELEDVKEELSKAVTILPLYLLMDCARPVQPIYSV